MNVWELMEPGVVTVGKSFGVSPQLFWQNKETISQSSAVAKWLDLKKSITCLFVFISGRCTSQFMNFRQR